MKKNISISFKVIVFLLISIALMMVIFSSAYFIFSFHVLKDRIKRNSGQDAEKILKYSAELLSGAHSEMLEKNLINEMFYNEEISAITLKYGDMPIAAAARDDEWNAVITDRNAVDDKNDGSALRSMKTGDGLLTIDIQYTYKFIFASQLRQMFFIMAQTSLISVVIVFILYFLLSRIVLKPLLLLKNALAYLSKKNFIYSTEELSKTNDEIGELSMSFNNMARELACIMETKEKYFNELNLEISQRKKSEENLNITKNYLKTILNSLPSMIFSTDSEGGIIEMNSCADAFVKIPQADISSSKIWSVIPFLKNYEEEIRQSLNNSNNCRINNVIYEMPDKKYFDIFIQPFTFDDLDGSVVRIDDVTELENKKHQLIQAQKMEMIGTLSAGIAHDFNNILSAIIGTLSIIRYREKAGDSIDKQAMDNYLNTIEIASNRAKNLIQQILTISKKNEHDYKSIDLRKLIQNVHKLFKNTFDKCVEIILDIEEGSRADSPDVLPVKAAVIYGDSVQIEQVLLNICVNAYHSMTVMCKSTDKWGGKLSIGLKEINADRNFINMHPIAKMGSYWQISVNDTGVGIKRELLTKIFEPFFSTKDKEKGTGLGLSIAYRIIKEHEGFITVYSEQDIGTCFNIFLPVYNEKKSADFSSGKKIYYGKGRILFIDDEEMVRHIGATMLSHCGYEVIKASDAEEGLNLYMENSANIDLVVLDMIMPKISGNQLFQKMKTINPEIKVILSSGFRKDERVENTLKLGALGFIQKPFSIEELSKKAFEILNRN